MEPSRSQPQRRERTGSIGWASRRRGPASLMPAARLLRDRLAGIYAAVAVCQLARWLRRRGPRLDVRGRGRIRARASAAAARISTTRVTAARITTARISAARISAARIPAARVSAAGIAAAWVSATWIAATRRSASARRQQRSEYQRDGESHRHLLDADLPASLAPSKSEHRAKRRADSHLRFATAGLLHRGRRNEAAAHENRRHAASHAGRSPHLLAKRKR